MSVAIRKQTGFPLAFQRIEDRKTHFVQGHKNRFRTRPFGYLGQRKNLTFSMGMFIIGGRVRVYDHYPVHVVHVGKHRNAYLIRHKQREQHQREVYVPILPHNCTKLVAKIVFFC